MNPFDTISGLPVHPLVVHAAVVLFPLGVVGLAAIVLSRTLRERYGWLAMAILVAGALSVPIAKESGEQLAHRIGEPATHAEYGDRMTVAAFVTTALALAWWLLDRLARRRAITTVATDGGETLPADGARGAHPVIGSRGAHGGEPSMLIRVLGPLAALAGIVGLVLTVLTGHSGATAAWSGQMTTQPTSASTPTATYTMAQVKQHASASSCWTTIDGKVYDLTRWIGSHPGGADVIMGLCGIDGTTAFTQKHGTEARPKKTLATYVIGTLQG